MLKYVVSNTIFNRVIMNWNNLFREIAEERIIDKSPLEA